MNTSLTLAIYHWTASLKFPTNSIIRKDCHQIKELT